MLPSTTALITILSCCLAAAAGAADETRHAGTTKVSAPADAPALRAALLAAQHAVRAVPDGYQARNPGQRWQTHFDGHGFSTRPDAGGWSWGLELRAYGLAGRERTVGLPVSAHSSGRRVHYDWDRTLREWYQNDERGLEHGYTVRRRPDAGTPGTGPGNRGGPHTLVFLLAVRGELHPKVAPGGRSVRFVLADGRPALTYSGLTVSDAEGRRLPARFARVPEGLQLIIDERGARYPLDIDPIAQQAYLKASNTGAGDVFGWSVAVSGDTAVVGAFREDSAAVGVDGDQSSNAVMDSGAVYVFVRDRAIWTQQAYLKASNTDLNDRFGLSVAISGDTIVVGAPGEDSQATGVNGNPFDDSVTDSGAAFVFVRNGTTWSQQAYLKASNTGLGDFFGGAVSISGDTIVVGAESEGSSDTGVNGNQLDNASHSAGAAYAFTRSGTTWSQQAYLKASNTDIDDLFGSAVAVSGDTLVIGAFQEDSLATGIDGNQLDNSGQNAGAAYVFTRSGTTWSQQAYLKASNTDALDNFGMSVALDADTIVVGAEAEDSLASGVNGDQSNASGSLHIEAGAAYVFARAGAVWSQQAYLKASDPDIADTFGHAVAVSGDTVMVGAYLEDSSARGINGDDSNDGVTDSGAAYEYFRTGTSWSLLTYLKASNSGTGDHFGWSIAVSGDTTLAGVPVEDSAATGVDGEPFNNNASTAGAAFVFAPSPWSDQGCALAGVTGEPLLTASGTLAGGKPNTVDLSNAAHSATAGLFLALSSSPVPFKGGTLCAFPILRLLVLTTNSGGAISIPFSLAPGVPAGTELWLQWAIQDAAAVQGVSLSNALKGVTP